jgi:hypothetical protein
MLKIVNCQREHPGFTFIENAESCPPAVEAMSDGCFMVDPTRYIALPADIGAWTEEIAATAYARLAATSLDDIDELIKHAIGSFSMRRGSLRIYCEAMGYDLPRFWFSKERTRQSNKRRETEARSWFAEVARGRKRRLKREYFVEMRRKFPGIPRDAFDRIWMAVVPADWRKPGPVDRTYEARSRS